MKRKPPGEGRTTPAVLPLAVLLGALLLSVPAWWSTLAFWGRLPVIQSLRVDPERLQAAWNRAIRQGAPEVREAFALWFASIKLSDSCTGAVNGEDLQTAVADAHRIVAGSHLGRLQQVAVRMRLLEQRGAPVEQWWPVVRPYLEGLRRAEFAHRQHTLTALRRDLYVSLGVDPGTACELAEHVRDWHAHGTFLQYLAERVLQIRAEREQAGDAVSAATCRTVLRRLLKQWVLEPGPAGTRLLAADLLARDLEADARPADSDALDPIATDMRAWRTAYRAEVRRCPVATLSAHSRPLGAPVAHERLLGRLGWTTWLAGATLAATVAALALAWFWLGIAGTRPGGREILPYAFGVTVLLGVGGAVRTVAWPDSVRAEARGLLALAVEWEQGDSGADAASTGTWAYYRACVSALVAAGLALGGVAAAALLQGRRTGGKCPLRTRLGASAGGTWLLLVLALWGATLAGEAARRDYEASTRAACEDAVAAVIGPEGDRLLDGLRRWEP